MNLQRFFGIRGISMACPCCMEPAKLRLNQINKKIGCPKCRGKFEADPDAKLGDVIRIYAGCSITKDHYAVAFKRGEFGKHRFFTTFNPGGDSKFWTHGGRSYDIPIEEIDFGNFECGCGNRVLDLCGKCGLWICQGGAHSTPDGRANICPSCGPAFYTTPITKMKIAEAQPMQSEVSISSPALNGHPAGLVRPTGASGLALTKWRGQ